MNDLKHELMFAERNLNLMREKRKVVDFIKLDDIVLQCPNCKVKFSVAANENREIKYCPYCGCKSEEVKMDKEKIQELDMKIIEVIEMIAEGMDRGYNDEYVETLYIAKDGLIKLEKIKQIVNSEADPNICNNFDYVYKIQAIKKIMEQE